MRVVALLLLLAPAPGRGAPPDVATLLVVSSRGEAFVPVTRERGHAALAAPLLAQALPLGVSVDVAGRLATVALAGHAFEFPLDAPGFRLGGRLYPLARPAYVVRDTLFVPLQWLADYVPRLGSERYRYDPIAARFDDLGVVTPSVAGGATAGAGGADPTRPGAPPPEPPVAPLARADVGAATVDTSRPTPAALATERSPAPLAARALGLRWRHVVTVDAGHGGRDAGNPGRFFPRGMQEKDVTLAIAVRLRAALEARGIGVIMTRMTDVFVPLGDRGVKCAQECDPFVSIHVNSMPRGRRWSAVNGVETYFLADAKTEEALRVQAMENEAIRFETDGGLPSADDPLGFILRDLQLNEHLRESAELAAQIQNRVARIHPGENRGVAQAPFYVLLNARRPAVLVETGFATHERDAAFLASPRGQRAIAESLADGVVAYLLQYERKLAVDEGA